MPWKGRGSTVDENAVFGSRSFAQPSTFRRKSRVQPGLSAGGLSAETRAAYVEALGVGLGPEDEPFLESALDDKSRQVRAEAVRLLATLPASRFAGRMTARLHERVEVAAEGTAVVVTLRTEASEATEDEEAVSEEE